MNKQKEILRISKKLGLSHIGSCLSVLPILEEIYREKKSRDKVLLDGAHAHLAHLMFTHPKNAEELIKKYGIHCDRAICDATGGSLGHALGIGIGMALVNRANKVYVIVTDGSMMEGSNWEALRIISDLKLDNLKIYCNFNSYTAVAKIDLYKMVKRMMAFKHGINYRFTSNTKRFDGLKGHYMKI
jgi:transketolase N-terminal domain/subunit